MHLLKLDVLKQWVKVSEFVALVKFLDAESIVGSPWFIERCKSWSSVNVHRVNQC